MQTTNQTYTEYLFLDIQTGCLVESAWGTEPNSTQQVWYIGIQDVFYLD